MKPADLPFFVVHARVAWPVAIVALSLLLAAAWFMVRWRVARWRFQNTVLAREAAVQPVGTGTRMLRGQLHGGDAASGQRNDELWLDCDGVRVDIRGKLRLDEGEAVRDGERMLLQGAVRRDGEQWIVEPPAVHGPAWWRGEMAPSFPVRRADGIAAWREGRKQPRSTWASRGIAVALSAALAYGALRLIGSIALDSLHHADDVVHAPAIGALSLAVIVGPERDRALSLYDDKLASVHNEEAVGKRLALAELRGDCVGAAEILIAAGYWEQARQRAHHCENQDLALKTAVLTGHFDEIAPDARLYWRGFAAIARRDWTKASQLADELASKYPNEKTACLREYLHKAAGAPFDDRVMLTCDVVRAAEGLELTNEVPSISAELLRAVATGCRADWQPYLRYDAINLGYAQPGDAEPWLGSLCPASTTVMSLALRTRTALIRGDSAAIAHELDDAIEASIGRVRRKLQEQRTLVQLRSAAIVPFDEDLDLHVDGHPSALRSGHSFETNAPDTDALRAAASGDGHPLAEILLRCRSECPNQLDLIGVLPRIHTAREDVIAALRIRWFSLGYRPIASPFVAPQYAALERDIAHLIGDAGAQRRWQAIVDAHAAVYAANDVLVALLIWQDLLG